LFIERPEIGRRYQMVMRGVYGLRAGSLRQLEAEGPVTFYPHRGAIVSSPALEEIGELFKIRALIEPDVLRRAIPHLASANIEGRGPRRL
jgi:hypothetical protein